MFERFGVDQVPDGVSVLTSASKGSEGGNNCVFNHVFAVSWEEFGNSSLKKCGFAETGLESSRSYEGRIFLEWEDFENETAKEAVEVLVDRWVSALVSKRSFAN